MPDPQGEEPDGLRTLTPVGEPLQYNYFPVCGSPTGSMGFDYITKAPLLLSHCVFFFVFGCRVSFLVGSSLFFGQWLFNN